MYQKIGKPEVFNTPERRLAAAAYRKLYAIAESFLVGSDEEFDIPVRSTVGYGNTVEVAIRRDERFHNDPLNTMLTVRINRDGYTRDFQYCDGSHPSYNGICYVNCSDADVSIFLRAYSRIKAAMLRIAEEQRVDISKFTL